MSSAKMHADELGIDASLVGRLIAAQFRKSAGVDDATWARGRGWALCFGLMAEHHYRATNPIVASVGRRAMLDALAGHE